MLDTLTIDQFKPHLGQIFHFIVDGERLPVKLTDAFPWGPSDIRPRQPFSLIFHTIPQAVVPQAVYRVESEVMEPLEIFLTPLEPDERGMRYEAVFT